MERKLRKLTLAEKVEFYQTTQMLNYRFQQAVESDEPIAALHESLQLIADSTLFQNFDWNVIDTALNDVLNDRQTIQSAAAKAALQITGLSIAQRL